MSGRNLADMARGIKADHLPNGGVTAEKLANNAVGANALHPDVTPVTTKLNLSDEYDIAAGAAHDWEHSLGSLPKKHGIKLKCVAAERGYQAGEVIDFPNHNVGVGGNNHNIAVSADADHIHVKFGPTSGVFGGGGPVLFIRRDNGGSETLTAANWKLILWAEI